MQQLPAEASLEAPPTARDLIDARAEFERRYPGILARGRTTAGAAMLPDVLIDAAVSEDNRDVKWFMLSEARRMAVASGNAAALDRAVVLASATFEFDALAEEYRLLREIPIRMLAPPRAAAMVEAAGAARAARAAPSKLRLGLRRRSGSLRSRQYLLGSRHRLRGGTVCRHINCPQRKLGWNTLGSRRLRLCLH